MLSKLHFRVSQKQDRAIESFYDTGHVAGGIDKKDISVVLRTHGSLDIFLVTVCL